MGILSNIDYPAHLKHLKPHELDELCSELRTFLIETILQNGGHFAGNLGVVELSVALHYVFDFNTDKIVWDVGHQSYIHKILTGRKNQLHQIRNYNGISGFPKMAESSFDHFGTGHSSTSISAALGMAIGAKLKGELKRKTIAIVGDGALTGGETFEALNNLASSNANILVIINDNHIGIDPNTGAIDQHLQDISDSDSNIFQNLQIPYTGPIDGHDIKKLLKNLEQSKAYFGPQILHVKTIKGKGHNDAEQEQTRWHSTAKYVKIDNRKGSTHKWQDVFADTLIELAEEFPSIVGITPAMPSGSGMIKAMQKFPSRFFDVGIAEQHAVTFAAGLATESLIPILNIYSTFLQRGYDQLIHDVALQKLPVIFCVDRAGLVGEDGPTHHGAFDISFLRCVPNLIISAPKDEIEFRNLLFTAVHEKKPFSIRYPKGNGFNSNYKVPMKKMIPGSVEILNSNSKTAIISTGIATQFASEALKLTKNKPTLIHFPFIKPLNFECLNSVFNTHEHIITVEDGSIIGGFGESVVVYANQCGFTGTIKQLGIPDEFVTHGDNQILYDLCGFSPQKIANEVNSYETN